MLDELFENKTPDPKKLFNEKEYRTIVLGDEGASKKDEEKADWLFVLIEENTTREEKDEALNKLKEEKSQDFLIQSASKMKAAEVKAKILSACWETGLDFSNQLPFFIDIILDHDYLCALEAYTVIENNETRFDPEQIKTAIEKLSSQPEDKAFVSYTILLLQSQLIID